MNSSAKPTNSTTASAPTEEEDLLAEFDHLFASDAEPDLAALASVPPLTVDDIALDELIDGLESQISILDAAPTAPSPPIPPHTEPVADEPLADFEESLATVLDHPEAPEAPASISTLIEPLDEPLDDPSTEFSGDFDPLADLLDEPDPTNELPATALPLADPDEWGNRVAESKPVVNLPSDEDRLDTDLLESLLTEQEPPESPPIELVASGDSFDPNDNGLDFDLESLLQDQEPIATAVEPVLEPSLTPAEDELLDELEPLTAADAPEQALDELLADDPLEDLDQLLEDLDGAEVLPIPTDPTEDQLNDDPFVDPFDEPIAASLPKPTTAPLTASDDLDDIGELDFMSSTPSPNRDDLTTDTDDTIADLDDLLQEHDLKEDDLNHLDDALLDDLEESLVQDEDLNLDLDLDGSKPQNSAAPSLTSEDELDELESLLEEEESNDFSLEGKSEELPVLPSDTRSGASQVDNDMDNLDELDNLLDDDLDLDDTDLDLAAGLNSRDSDDSNDLLDDLIDTSTAAAPVAAVAAAAAVATPPPAAALSSPPSPPAAAEPKIPPAKPSASAEPPQAAKEGKPVSKLQLAIIGAALAINLIIGGLAFYYASRLSGDIHQTTTQVDTLKEDLEASYTREIPEVVENRSNITLLDKRVNTLATSVDGMKGFKSRTEEELSSLQQRYDEISTVVTEQQKEQEAAAARQKEEAAKKRLAEAKQRKPPATATDTAAAKTEPKKPKPTGWVINLATMTSESQAKQAKQQLAQAGMTAMIQKITVNKKSHYRVQVGNYKTRDEATLNALNLPDQPEFDRAWVGMAE